MFLIEGATFRRGFLIISLILELKNSYWKKWKRYLHDLFEKLYPKRLEHNEDFDYHINNVGLQDIIGKASMQNFTKDD